MGIRRVLLLIVMGPFACLLNFSATGQSIQDRFARSISNAQAVTSVVVQMIETTVAPNMPVGDGTANLSSTYEYTYFISGPKFRVTRRLIAAAQTNSVRLSEVAYDGTTFVTYDADTQRMIRQETLSKSTSSELFYNPLIAPFMFLSENSDNCHGCMVRFWDLKASNLGSSRILPDGILTNGLVHLTVPGLPLGAKPTFWNIDIPKAGSSFDPETITYIAEAGGVEDVWKLRNYTRLGDYQFPATVEMIERAYPPTSRVSPLFTTTVNVTSARAPDEIDDSVFELNEATRSAVTIFDGDTGKFAYSAYDEVKAGFLKGRANIYDENADGAKQIAEALAAAKKSGKRVMLQFGANWCVPCHQLHSLCESDESIVGELSSHYVVALIDVSQGHNKEMVEKYGNPTRFGLPVIVVLDARGEPLVVQNTADLNEPESRAAKSLLGDHISAKKVVAFLKKWARED